MNRKWTLVVILGMFSNLLPAQRTVQEANFSLHQTRKQLMKQSADYLECDRLDFPNTSKCNFQARIGASVMKSMDEKFGGD